MSLGLWRVKRGCTCVSACASRCKYSQAVGLRLKIQPAQTTGSTASRLSTGRTLRLSVAPWLLLVEVQGWL